MSDNKQNNTNDNTHTDKDSSVIDTVTSVFSAIGKVFNNKKVANKKIEDAIVKAPVSIHKKERIMPNLVLGLRQQNFKKGGNGGLL